MNAIGSAKDVLAAGLTGHADVGGLSASLCCPGMAVAPRSRNAYSLLNIHCVDTVIPRPQAVSLIKPASHADGEL